MDSVKILKRAWQILWNYPVLWIFGLIIAMTAAGSAGGGGNSGSRFSANDIQTQTDFQFPKDILGEFNHFGEGIEDIITNGIPSSGISSYEISTILGLAGVFVLVLLISGILMTIAGYISNTSVISMVNEYEESDTKLSFREGFKKGWSVTSWRLFLINFLLHIPTLFLLAVVGVIGFRTIIIVSNTPNPFSTAGVIGLIGLAFLSIFILIILATFLKLIRNFVWRVCVLEKSNIRDSFKQGFAIVRKNWQSVGMMWLVMIGVGIVWMVVSFVSFFLLIPVVIITSLIALIIAIIPGLFLVAFFAIFLNGALPWIVGGIFVLPLFAMIAFSPWTLITAWQKVYESSVWTLTYRELSIIPLISASEEINPDIA